MRTVRGKLSHPINFVVAACFIVAGCSSESQITSLPGDYSEKVPEVAERVINAEGGLLDTFRGYRDYYFHMSGVMQGIQSASNQPPLSDEDLDVYKTNARMIAGMIGVSLDEKKFWNQDLSDDDEDAMFADLRKQLLNKLPKYVPFKNNAPEPLIISDDLSFSYKALNIGYRGEIYQCTAPDIDLLNQAGQLPMVCQDDDGEAVDAVISTDGLSITIEVEGYDLGRRYYPVSGS
jgi:hypothetical protein